MNDIEEESPDTSQKATSHSVGIGFSSTRSLLRPPSSSVFAPDLKLNLTSVRTSLTPSSPTLLLATYRMESTDSPQLDQNNNPWKRARDSTRLSTSSIFGIPTFPSPCHDIGSIRSIAATPPTFAFSRPSNEYVQEIRTPDSPVAPSSVFESALADSTTSPPSLPGSAKILEEYDPNTPYRGFPTPLTGSPTQFSSPFAVVPAVNPSRRCGSRKHARSPSYSPPCSPKTIRPHSFLPISPDQPLSTFVSTAPAALGHEPLLDTIDPALLSNDVFTATTIGTNSNLLNSSTSTITPKAYNWNPTIASSLLDPLLEAAFPSQPRIWSTPPRAPPTHTDSHERSQSAAQTPTLRPQSPLIVNLNLHPNLNPPSTGEAPESPTSAYSSPSPPAPSSPRPAHATLPLSVRSKPLRLSEATTPALLPTPMGPRASPPKDLRRTVAELRRMNSDADSKGHGGRRYLRLGREASLAALSGIGDDSLWDESVLETDRQTLIIHENWEDAIITEEGETETGGVGDETFIHEEDESMHRRDNDNDRDGKETNGLLPEPDLDLDASILSKSFYASDVPDACSSSVWEDGERFWHSTPPRPRESQTPTPSPSPSLSPSPVAKPEPLRVNSTQYQCTSKKSFFVKLDPHSGNNDNAASNTDVPDAQHSGKAKRLYRARGHTNAIRSNALAAVTGTPNVRVSIKVQPPSNQGTPGSLYDADGFLRA